MHAARLLALLAIVVTTACTGSPRQRQADVRGIYGAAARHAPRNPVVVIHGILGARLEESSTGRTVWGAFTDDYADPRQAEGARLVALPLTPPDDADDAIDQPGPVVATGPLGKLRIGVLFGVVNVGVYADILRTLGVGGFVDPVLASSDAPDYGPDHFTCYSFFYDWRLDNVTNAIRLGRFLRQSRTAIDAATTRRIARLRQQGDAAAREQADELADWLQRGYRFDVVAHSMGGLIAHYYLRYGEADLPADGSTPPVTWAGTKEVGRLVQIGTPNLGAMEAFEQLLHGYQPSIVIPRFHPAILGTMPSIYQLLPRTRHGVLLDERGAVADTDLFDAEVWLANGWGLAAPEADEVLHWLLPQVADQAERRRIAASHLRWCLDRARRFHLAVDQPAPPTSAASFHLFAADGEPTLARVVLRRTDGRLVPDFQAPGTRLPGDVTVARYSALADERTGQTFRRWLRSPLRWQAVTFLSDDHVGLTANPHFVDNVLFLLLESPTSDS